MNKGLFFTILFVSATIIYLVLYKLTVSVKIEHFAVSNPNNRSDIAFKLGITESRIKNYIETGDITNPGEFKVEFDIYPRTIAQKDQPLVRELDKKMEGMKTKNETFKIKTEANKDVFLSKIDYQIIDLVDASTNTMKAKFTDNSIKPQIKYLEDQQSGMISDLGIEPRLKFVNGELKEIPLPTYAPTPSPSTAPSRRP